MEKKITDNSQIELDDGKNGMVGYINESKNLILQISNDIEVPENKPNRTLEFTKVP